MQRLDGAYSIVALSEGKLVAFRDPHGFRPLVLGRIHDDWVVASETCALDLVGAEFVREVERGEAIVVDENGLHIGAGGRAAVAGRALHLRVLLSRAARHDARRHRGARRAPAHGRAARARGAGRRRSRAADPRLGHAGRDRLLARDRHPVQRRPDQEPLRRPHVHPARPGAAPPGHQAEVQSARRGRGQARRRRRRLDRARQHDAADRADAEGRGRDRGARAHLVAAGDRPVLLRHRPRRSRTS